MFVRIMAVLALTTLCLSAAGCAQGQHPASPTSDPLPQPAVEVDSDLPALADLPDPSHGSSLLGPGWFDINPVDPSYWRGGSGTSALPAALTIAGTAGPGFALYSVSGFDGDNAPTSLRVEGQDYSGEYYVGFSCYGLGEWLFAGPFTGDAETTIPNTGSLTQPTAFITPAGTTYFTVIVPESGNLQVTGLSLGIDGGGEGPQPVNDFYGTGATAGVLLSWLPSASCNDLDFAGYHIERAPRTWGDYTPVATVGPLVDYCLDTDVEVNTVYRYRIDAFDINGNRSTWFTSTGGSNVCWTDNPVAVLDIPAGPLLGPVDVTFDMTASFDQNGGTIDHFILTTGAGIELYDGSAPSTTCTLQPGCYTLKLRIVTTDFREDTTVRYLKVYPRWRPDSVVVSYPDELYPRLTQLRSIMHPATGLLTYYAIDDSCRGLSVWTRQPDGSFDHRSLPVFDAATPRWVGEPVVLGSEVLVPVNMNGLVNVAHDNGTELGWAGNGINNCQGHSVALAYDPGRGEVWLLYLREMPVGTFKPVLRSLNTNDLLNVSTAGASDTQLDMVWNPTDNCFDIAHSTPGGTIWSRFEPDSGITRTETLGVKAEMLDIEISPYTGQPAVLYFSTSRQRFRELDASASVWCPEIILDNSVDNRSLADLLATGDSLYAMVLRDSAAGEMFEYDGTDWTMRNEVQFAASVPYTGPTLADIGSGEIALGVLDDDYATRFTFVHADGTRTDVHTQLPLEGQGFALSAAGGDPDLHVTWPIVGNVAHFTSPDGETWTEQPKLSGGRQPELFGSSDGKVFLSHQAGGQANLSRWDGSTWDPWKTSDTDVNTWPVATAQPFNPAPYWGVYDDTVVPAEFNWTYCGSWPSTTIYNPAEIIWAGTVNNEAIYNVFCLYGSSSTAYAATGFYSTSNNDFMLLFSNPHQLNNDSYTAGRTLDSSAYNIRGGHFMQPVYWAAYGPNYAPVRVERDQQDCVSFVELPFTMDWEQSDWRRSVSALYTDGGSAVGLVCSATGSVTWFEWDDFGNWEDLPLPEDLGPMALPELVKSMDGRWHIIYRDYLNDRVMCRSTL